jgi:hypothetical protein
MRSQEMFEEEEEGPAEAATGFADQFVDSGVAKLDAVFGAGYAKQNPQALAAYVGACASDLGAFMTAAMALQEEAAFDDALAAFEEEEILPEPAPRPKGRRG